MLEFVNKPPQGSEDVSLSETGKALLLEAKTGDSIMLHAYGKAVCSETVDSFSGDSEADPSLAAEVDPLLAEAIGERISEEAELLLEGAPGQIFVFSRTVANTMNDLVAFARTGKVSS